MGSKSLDGVLIKRPHQVEKMSHEQLVDFALCADPVTGPLYFMTHHFYIQHPVKGKLLYAPFQYQFGLIDTYHMNRFSINMLGRQLGKTATAAGYLLWYAMFTPDATILIAAHKFAGAQEIMQRIRYSYESSPNHIRAGVTGYNKGSIEFDNGSRIISQATTENTGRGLSLTLLYVDEFAFVRPNIAKEFWTSISPTLATGGRAIITSTPNNDEDQFAQIWHGANKCIDEFGNHTHLGINGFRAYKAYWHEHPDRDAKWKAEEEGRIGEERFRREHNIEFISFDETLIASLTLATLSGVAPIEKQGQVRWFKKPTKGHAYVVALDPSLGTGGDNAAIQVFELPYMIQVAEWMNNRTPITQQINLLCRITAYLAMELEDITKVYYSVENNTLGEAALVSIAEIGEENISGVFLTEPKRTGNVRAFRRGFNTTNKTKLAACAKLKSLIESSKMTVNSGPLVSELKVFVAKGAGYEAKEGETDDLVMSTILAVRMAQALQSYDPTIDATLRDKLDADIMPMPFIMS
jgi:hypothetical protein